MSNMMYCRFQNTELDLDECMEALQNEELTQLHEDGTKLSRDEFDAAIRIIKMAKEIAAQFEDLDECEALHQWRTLE